MENVKMQPRNLAFLLSEASGIRSRSIVTIETGAGKLAAGTVLGKLSATGEYVPSPAAEVVGKEGAEIALAILAYGIDATDHAVEVAAIDGDAEVKLPMLIFDASVDDDNKTKAKVEQLRAVGIRAR